MADCAVTLTPVSRKDGAFLGNLLELYIHDLSAMFDVELGADGRFGYPELATYLAGSGERFAFLVRCDQRVAGFILVRRGSPLAENPDVLDIAEFFVLRRFRGRGVGRASATLLWDRVRGAWIIRAFAANPDAVTFWRSVIGTYTNGTAREAERRDGATAWVVFSFDNAA